MIEDPPVSRSNLARSRIAAARAELRHCQLCAHDCGANRLNGETGPCHAGSEARVFSAQTEVSDEPELAPVFAVAFSGCDLRCAFCITGRPSWNPRAGEALDAAAIARRAEAALTKGARTIMFLGGEPTIHLPFVIEIVSLLPDHARLVWKTNAHASRTARELAEGLFDVWLADYKFGNDVCAQRLAKVQDYTRIVRENLAWMAQPGRGELIVRHLLMPGHLECCWRPVAEWLARKLPAAKVSLMTGFWPGWHSARHSELVRPVSDGERELAWELARGLGLNFC